MLITPMASTKKIYILEDDDESRLLYEEILSSEGYTILSASDGQEAINFLEKTQDLPDGIIMDLSFPMMSAEQFVSKLNSNTRLNKIPFLVISGHVDTEERAEKLRAKGFLKKPFDIEQLLAAVCNLLIA